MSKNIISCNVRQMIIDERQKRENKRKRRGRKGIEMGYGKGDRQLRKADFRAPL